MPYVSRDDTAKINGVYANLQPGYGEEFLPDDHPDVVAYLAPPKVNPSAALQSLQMEIAKVAPVISVSVVNWDDRATWAVDLDPNATPEQKAAAAGVVAAFDPRAVPTKLELAVFDHENRIRAIERALTKPRETSPNSTTKKKPRSKKRG
jgi:hypothetical protein